MANIYKAPSSLQIPSFTYTGKDSLNAYLEAEKKYLEDLATLLKNRNPKDPYVGKIIKFPIADGYALYMVASLKRNPIELIHIEIGDAWNFPYIERLTKKDILAEIQRQEAIGKLFGKKD